LVHRAAFGIMGSSGTFAATCANDLSRKYRLSLRGARTGKMRTKQPFGILS
jgi:hypothetical protein